MSDSKKVIKYVGPSPAVTAEGHTFLNNHYLEVDEDLANRLLSQGEFEEKEDSDNEEVRKSEAPELETEKKTSTVTSDDKRRHRGK